MCKVHHLFLLVFYTWSREDLSISFTHLHFQFVIMEELQKEHELGKVLNNTTLWSFKYCV
jgi:hypothetical protein